MRRRSGSLLASPVLVGVGVLLVILTAVYLSYTAQNGLPFLATYRVSVALPSAAQLTKNADVRIGGARIGQVLSIAAFPPRRGQAPYARLQLALDPGVGPVPADTRVQLRLSSVLGGKYIELHLGRSRRLVPDGGSLRLGNAQAIVGLDDAFRVFDPPTRRELGRVLSGLGTSFAGRGADLNNALGDTSRLLPPLERVLRLLADPSTGLAAFIRGAAATTSALAPVSGQLVGLLDHGATTLLALERAGGALGRSIDALPPFETRATRVLRRVRPVLHDAAAIAVALRPGARLLPSASRELDAVLHATQPVLARAAELTVPLDATFAATGRFAREPTAIPAFRALKDNDLASFGASAFVGLGAILREAAPAQLHCNVVALWARNLSSVFSEGDAGGTWIRMLTVVDPSQTFQSAAPAADLHFNPYPNENARECEAGNEPYLPGQRIGNPAGLQSTKVDVTGRAARLGRRG